MNIKRIYGKYKYFLISQFMNQNIEEILPLIPNHYTLSEKTEIVLWLIELANIYLDFEEEQSSSLSII